MPDLCPYGVSTNSAQVQDASFNAAGWRLQIQTLFSLAIVRVISTRGNSHFCSHNKRSERETLVAFVAVQRLLSQQQAVVQHIQPPEEVGVDLHLPQQPRALAVCTQHRDSHYSSTKNHFGVLCPAIHRGGRSMYFLPPIDPIPNKIKMQPAHFLPRLMYWPSKLRSFRTTIIWLPTGAGSVHRLTSQPLMSYLAIQKTLETHRIPANMVSIIWCLTVMDTWRWCGRLDKTRSAWRWSISAEDEWNALKSWWMTLYFLLKILMFD